MDKETDQSETPPRAREEYLRVGVIMRRRPGVTRWAKWHWQPVSIATGAVRDPWTVIRSAGEVTDYYAGSVDIHLHRADIAGYQGALDMSPPSVFAGFDPDASTPSGWRLAMVTASSDHALNALDSAETLVERITMPDEVRHWVVGFVEAHYREDVFVKRKRKRYAKDRAGEGLGDARIPKASDVYRAPDILKKRLETDDE